MKKPPPLATAGKGDYNLPLMDSTDSRLHMAGKFFRIILLAVTLLTAGCAAQRPHPPPPSSPDHHPPARATAPGAEQVLRSILETHLADWRGVPHRLGGASRKGIDCSAFVQMTFREKFGVTLPRTTREQALVGSKVRRAALAGGDLVFFRIGPNQRHVGIYLGDDRFMHVSYSQGVMQSSLSESYWRLHFWQARRVLSPAGRMAAGESHP
jgi:cell wall-associated NlpC family hydrolase